jgi:predicted RNase H-like nuclease (RuvC/YqgF family)
MKNKFLLDRLNGEKPFSEEYISDLLESIDQKLDEEIGFKQQTITRQENEIEKLRTVIEEKNVIIRNMYEKVAECQRVSEGNRQLVNKLLSDIDRLKQDIEWYRRTYVKRSLLGTVKEKLFGKRS